LDWLQKRAGRPEFTLSPTPFTHILVGAPIIIYRCLLIYNIFLYSSPPTLHYSFHLPYSCILYSRRRVFTQDMHRCPAVHPVAHASMTDINRLVLPSDSTRKQEKHNTQKQKRKGKRKKGNRWVLLLRCLCACSHRTASSLQKCVLAPTASNESEPCRESPRHCRPTTTPPQMDRDGTHRQ
jgi:hypothetical protein